MQNKIRICERYMKTEMTLALTSAHKCAQFLSHLLNKANRHKSDLTDQFAPTLYIKKNRAHL